MKILDEYMKLQEEIYDYFGYIENWCVIPIEDRREMYWILEQNEDGNGNVKYSDKSFTPEIMREGEEYYQDSIYTQRFLQEWVYRGEDYTMVCCDTHTDGNKFLAIFDNAKEEKMTEELKKAEQEFLAMKLKAL